MKNHKIDKLLLEISKDENYQIFSEDYFDDYNEYIDYRKTLIMMLDDVKLIAKPINNSSHIIITKFGDDVINQGGWIKYLENEQNEKENEINRQSKADKILDLDLQLKNFEKKYEKKLIIGGFIITLLSFLITVLTVQYMQGDENNKKQKNQEESQLKHNKPKKTDRSLN
jgi:hypothetical protein